MGAQMYLYKTREKLNGTWLFFPKHFILVLKSVKQVLNKENSCVLLNAQRKSGKVYLILLIRSCSQKAQNKLVEQMSGQGTYFLLVETIVFTLEQAYSLCHP